MGTDKELDAMTAIAKALDSFEETEVEIVARIVNWTAARYKVAVGPTRGPAKGQVGTNAAAQPSENQFADIAELFSVASVKTDVERALLAGYWLMTGEGKAEFTGQEANDHLKNLGHPVGNITDAYSSLISRRPALVMQVAKSGTSKQARKKYKLTRAGMEHVTRLANGTAETEE